MLWLIRPNQEANMDVCVIISRSVCLCQSRLQCHQQFLTFNGVRSVFKSLSLSDSQTLEWCGQSRATDLQPVSLKWSWSMNHPTCQPFFSVISWLVSQLQPDQPTYISTTYRPPIIPQRKADCENKRDSSVIMSEQQQTVDSSLSCRIQRCFSPKKPIWQPSVWLWELGLFLLLPHILTTPALGCTTTE